MDIPLNPKYERRVIRIDRSDIPVEPDERGRFLFAKRDVDKLGPHIERYTDAGCPTWLFGSADAALSAGAILDSAGIPYSTHPASHLERLLSQSWLTSLPELPKQIYSGKS